MNFRKVLPALGLFTLATPATFSVLACGNEIFESFNFTELTKTGLQEVLNNYKDEKIPVKNQTYEDFFHLKNTEKGYNFLEYHLYTPIRNWLAAQDVEPKEFNEQVQEVLKWSRKAITLVYVDYDKDDQDKTDRKVIETFNRQTEGTLEKIFVTAVKKHHGITDDKYLTPEFWEKNNKASLALAINPKVANITLDPEKIPAFLTFTFATEE